MRISATYTDGRLELPPGIELITNSVDIVVEIPDDALRTDADVKQKKFSVRRRIDAILGPPPPRGSSMRQTVRCKDIWHEHLEEKYLVER